MKRAIYLVLIVIGILMTACGSKKPIASTVAYTNHATECIGADPAGYLRLRVWGEGKDKKAALEQAKKKAVEEVSFNNLTAGTEKGHSWPIIDNPTIRRTQSAYFAKFFKDGGEYKKYIKAEKPGKEEYFTGNDKWVVPVEITVDKEGLREKYIKDGIIK